MSFSLLTKADIRRGFNKLQRALQDSKLPCEQGGSRWAEVSEFMCMGYDFSQGHWQFKHYGTRNYVFVTKDGQLHVPMTDKPFFLGYFDRR